MSDNPVITEQIKEAAKYILSVLDSNNNGGVTVDELLAAGGASSGVERHDLQAIFNMFDESNDGQLNAEELRTWLTDAVASW